MICFIYFDLFSSQILAKWVRQIRIYPQRPVLFLSSHPRGFESGFPLILFYTGQDDDGKKKKKTTTTKKKNAQHRGESVTRAAAASQALLLSPPRRSSCSKPRTERTWLCKALINFFPETYAFSTVPSLRRSLHAVMHVLWYIFSKYYYYLRICFIALFCFVSFSVGFWFSVWVRWNLHLSMSWFLFVAAFQNFQNAYIQCDPIWAEG